MIIALGIAAMFCGVSLVLLSYPLVDPWSHVAKTGYSAIVAGLIIAVVGVL